MRKSLPLPVLAAVSAFVIGGCSSSSDAPAVVVDFAPIARVVSPSAGQTTIGPFVTVRGTASSPGFPITEVLVDGKSATSDNGFADWTVDLELDSGVHGLLVELRVGDDEPFEVTEHVIGVQASLFSEPHNIVTDLRGEGILVHDDELLSWQPVAATGELISGSGRGHNSSFSLGTHAIAVSPSEPIVYSYGAGVLDDGRAARGVWEIHRDTGDRRLISGRIDDPFAPIDRGVGPRIDEIAPGADLAFDPNSGQLALLAREGDEVIYSVDVRFGDRRRLTGREIGSGPALMDINSVGYLDAARQFVLGSSTLNDLLAVDPMDGGRALLGVSAFSVLGYRDIEPRRDGRSLLLVANNGIVMRWDLSGGSANWVTAVGLGTPQVPGEYVSVAEERTLPGVVRGMRGAGPQPHIYYISAAGGASSLPIGRLGRGLGPRLEVAVRPILDLSRHRVVTVSDAGGQVVSIDRQSGARAALADAPAGRAALRPLLHDVGRDHYLFEATSTFSGFVHFIALDASTAEWTDLGPRRQVAGLESVGPRVAVPAAMAQKIYYVVAQDPMAPPGQSDPLSSWAWVYDVATATAFEAPTALPPSRRGVVRVDASGTWLVGTAEGGVVWRTDLSQDASAAPELLAGPGVGAGPVPESAYVLPAWPGASVVRLADGEPEQRAQVIEIDLETLERRHQARRRSHLPGDREVALDPERGLALYLGGAAPIVGLYELDAVTLQLSVLSR